MWFYIIRLVSYYTSVYGYKAGKKLTRGTDAKIELVQQRVVFSRESDAEAGEGPVDDGAQSGL